MEMQATAEIVYSLLLLCEVPLEVEQRPRPLPRLCPITLVLLQQAVALVESPQKITDDRLSLIFEILLERVIWFKTKVWPPV